MTKDKRKTVPSLADVKAKSAEASSIRDVLGPIFDSMPDLPEPWYRRLKPAQAPTKIDRPPLRSAGKAVDLPKSPAKPKPGPDQYSVEDRSGGSSVFQTETNARNYVGWLTSRGEVKSVVLRRHLDNHVWDWTDEKWRLDG